MTQKTKSRLRIAGVAALLVAVAAAVYLGFTQSRVEATETAEPKDATGTAEGDAPAAVPVEVTVVTTGPVASYLSATANLVPEDEVRVLAESEGRVASLAVEEGDRVARGQVLASLVRDEAEIELAKARVRQRNAEQALERAQGTMDKGLISREEFDRLEHGARGGAPGGGRGRVAALADRDPGPVLGRRHRADDHRRPAPAARRRRPSRSPTSTRSSPASTCPRRTCWLSSRAARSASCSPPTRRSGSPAGSGRSRRSSTPPRARSS